MAGPFNEVAYRFYENQTGEGSSGAVYLLEDTDTDGPEVAGFVGGTYIWSVYGTFGGAVVSLESLSPDDSNYFTVTSLSANGQQTVLVGQGETLRVTVTGGTPSALYSNIRRVS